MTDWERIDEQTLPSIKNLKDRHPVKFRGADLFTSEGYILYPRLIHFDPELKPIERTVFAVALHLARNKPYYAGGNEDISQYTGLHRNTISKAITRLEQLGHVVRDRRSAQKTTRLIFDYSLREDLLQRSRIKPIGRTAELDAMKVRLNLPEGADLMTTFGWIAVPGILYRHDLLDILFKEGRERPKKAGAAITKLTDTQTSVYSTLCGLNFNASPRIKQARLGAQIGRSVRVVEEAIQVLRLVGLVSVTRHSAFETNRYDLNLYVQQNNTPGDNLS